MDHQITIIPLTLDLEGDGQIAVFLSGPHSLAESDFQRSLEDLMTNLRGAVNRINQPVVNASLGPFAFGKHSLGQVLGSVLSSLDFDISKFGTTDFVNHFVDTTPPDFLQPNDPAHSSTPEEVLNFHNAPIHKIHIGHDGHKPVTVYRTIDVMGTEAVDRAILRGEKCESIWAIETIFLYCESLRGNDVEFARLPRTRLARIADVIVTGLA